MLHAVKSDTLLARPISVYASCQKNGFVEVIFLILLKGTGTQELCSLKTNDEIKVLGPLGNIFPRPASDGRKVLIVGGGIGVAPVAGFASSLPEKSYDFYASFKSGSYALDAVKADKLVITTDDGSVGVHGMLPAALTEEALKAGNYAAVYACGPSPMLSYVKKISEEIGKTPVQVEEAAGFVVNRILIPMINEAAFIKMEGEEKFVVLDMSDPATVENNFWFGRPMLLYTHNGLSFNNNISYHME